jgi:hypothetical protein
MWTTLVLHMHARYYVLNCGSNWHALIRRLRTSCGASPGTFFCLDHQHPQAPFFVCDMTMNGNKQNEACQNRSQASLDSLHVVEAAAAAERLQAEEEVAALTLVMQSTAMRLQEAQQRLSDSVA